MSKCEEVDGRGVFLSLFDKGLAFGASVSNGVMDLNGFVFVFVLVLVLFSWGGRALREALLMQSELFAGWAWLGWGSFRLVGGGEAASVGRADLEVLLDGRARNFGGWGFGDWRVGQRDFGEIYLCGVMGWYDIGRRDI
jgi:hypothetical protein